MKKTVFLSTVVFMLCFTFVFFAACRRHVPPAPQPAYQSVPQADTTTVTSPKPIAVPKQWEPVTIRATGSGAPRDDLPPGQARLMALRAAKVDGYRNLLEQTYGVRIQGDTTVRDFVTQQDVVRSKVDAFIRGAKETGNRTLSDGTVEVELEITLDQFFYDYFVPYMKK